MPRKTAIASASGIAAGIAITLAATGGTPPDGVHGMLLDTAVVLFPLIAVSIVGFTALRRWMNGHEERNRRDLAKISEQRQELIDDFTQRNEILALRSAQLDARATETNRAVRDTERQLFGLTQRLGEALSSNADERRERFLLQEEFDELATDYNQLVQGSLQERADQFARRAPAPATDATAPASVTRLRGLPEPRPDRGRPAESIGDPA